MISRNCSNQEFITELLDHPEAGPLMHGFIMNAIDQMARATANTPVDQLDTPMICGKSWQSCAKIVKRECDHRFGREVPTEH